ncbi:hypothetical protein [Microbulbifer thermotolerans]|uniref:hypothetical protein n=1 Tax=Microbulbifer thermotolerans TaxID=252514 RepID=UPI00224AB8FC|nr:hypothetical protein [Microbulbifer thermotolerans]MCX2834457.1 hypothetical protein [Microbulbifer thermotolerans]
MSLIQKIASIATGGLADTALKVAEKWFPPDMSEAEREQARLAFENLELERTRQAEKAALEAEQAQTERIRQLEGSASDLARIPLLGTVVLFLRGCQRPLWGFATLYLDWRWFTEWDLSAKQEAALWVINLLVLGFLFGERAVRNVSPLIAEIFRAKAGGK